MTLVSEIHIHIVRERESMWMWSKQENDRVRQGSVCIYVVFADESRAIEHVTKWIRWLGAPFMMFVVIWQVKRVYTHTYMYIYIYILEWFVHLTSVAFQINESCIYNPPHIHIHICLYILTVQRANTLVREIYIRWVARVRACVCVTQCIVDI